MSGAIRGNAPWTRTAVARLDPEIRGRIEAAIPDGQGITVICPGGSKGVYGAWCAGERTVGTHLSVAAACWAVLDQIGAKVA